MGAPAPLHPGASLPHPVINPFLPWLCVALISHGTFKMMRPLCSLSYLFPFLALLPFSNFNRNPKPQLHRSLTFYLLISHWSQSPHFMGLWAPRGLSVLGLGAVPSLITMATDVCGQL